MATKINKTTKLEWRQLWNKDKLNLNTSFSTKLDNLRMVAKINETTKLEWRRLKNKEKLGD